MLMKLRGAYLVTQLRQALYHFSLFPSTRPQRMWQAYESLPATTCHREGLDLKKSVIYSLSAIILARSAVRQE